MARQRDRVESYIAKGRAEGARLATGGGRPAHLDRGYFIEPTVFANVDNGSTIAREEIFGPVLSVMTFRTPEEVVQRANNTPYGLAAGVWTDKGSKVFEIASKLKAGVVWCNTYNRFDPSSPFGGYKESGFGREGGKHGLSAYLR
jgi:aldehyde dehydrogenase (NAD+)